MSRFSGDDSQKILELEKLTQKGSDGKTLIDKFSAAEKLEVIEIVASLTRKFSLSKLPMNKLLLIVSDMTQDCETDVTILLAENTIMMNELINIVKCWRSKALNASAENSYINHDCYNSVIFIFMAMVSGINLCRTFAQVSVISNITYFTYNEKSLTQSLDNINAFEELLWLASSLQYETKLITQQMIAEIVTRYDIFYTIQFALYV